MKKYLLSGVALLALATTAQAADLGARVYNKAPPMAPVAPVYNWTGFYIGGHIGGAWTSDDNFGFAGGFGNNNSSNSGFLGGVQVGGDYQFAPNWVIGIEGQWSWTDLSRNGAVGVIVPPATVPGFVANDKIDGIGSVTGRIGYTWGPGLLYFKGGWAWADRNFTVATFPGGLPVAFTGNNGNDNGYTLGGGLEWMFSPNWSGKIEYQFYNFGHNNAFIAPIGTIAGNDNVHTVKAGLNYRFNWGGPYVH
jgi:outer membrane immunogenic protein